MGVLLCVIRKKVVSLQKISRKKMKSKFLIWTIGTMALCLMSACANGDVQRVQKAEELLTVNRDSAMAILREVVRPDQLPEESKALYWFCVADIRANTMQSLSEDSMICWAAQYFRDRCGDSRKEGRTYLGSDFAAYIC